VTAGEKPATVKRYVATIARVHIAALVKTHIETHLDTN